MAESQPTVKGFKKWKSTAKCINFQHDFINNASVALRARNFRAKFGWNSNVQRNNVKTKI